MLASTLLKYLFISLGVILFTATISSAHAQYYQDDSGYGNNMYGTYSSRSYYYQDDTGYGSYHNTYDGGYDSGYYGRSYSSDVPRPSTVCLYKNAQGECMVEQRFDPIPQYSPTYTRNYQYQECSDNNRNNSDSDYNCDYFRNSNRNSNRNSFYNDYRSGYYQGSYYGRNHGDPRYDCWAPIDGDEDYKTICNDN